MTYNKCGRIYTTEHDHNYYNNSWRDLAGGVYSVYMSFFNPPACTTVALKVYKDSRTTYLGTHQWGDGHTCFDSCSICVDDWFLNCATVPYFANWICYTGLTTASTIYVKIGGDDSKSGTSWSDAKLTIKNALAVLTSSGTLHIGFGDYSAQATITLDKTMSLLCETATTGGGTGTVTLPPTT